MRGAMFGAGGGGNNATDNSSSSDSDSDVIAMSDNDNSDTESDDDVRISGHTHGFASSFAPPVGHLPHEGRESPSGPQVHEVIDLTEVVDLTEANDDGLDEFDDVPGLERPADIMEAVGGEANVAVIEEGAWPEEWDAQAAGPASSSFPSKKAGDPKGQSSGPRASSSSEASGASGLDYNGGVRRSGKVVRKRRHTAAEVGASKHPKRDLEDQLSDAGKFYTHHTNADELD